jgi:predicted alpha/beta superfamily hydrolase
MKRAVFVLLAMMLSPAESLAQSLPLPIPVRVEMLLSARLGEVREFWISLPDRYETSSQRYPVVYMLDGEINFNSGVLGGVRQASALGQIPEFIVVGIRNTDRSKDIFPEAVTYKDGTKDGGRANQFLDFIREELIPHVEKGYRASGLRVMYGTSNTGFTVVHGLFRNPDLANAYVAASATLAVPSFMDTRDTIVAGFKGGTRQLVLVMGERDLPTIISQNGALKESIDRLQPAGLTCRLKVVEDGEHVPPDSLVEGLRIAFRGWKASGASNPR